MPVGARVNEIQAPDPSTLKEDFLFQCVLTELAHRAKKKVKNKA